MECLLWACCWVKLVNISWTRLMFWEMKYWLLKKKKERKKYWLLLFVPSVVFPFDVYWMDTIARIIQMFNTFVCVRACVCVYVHVVAFHSTLCCYSCTGFLLLYLSRSHASAWFLSRPTLFLTLFNTSPLQACTWTQYPSILTAHSCSVPSPRFPFIHLLVHSFNK